MTKVVWATSSSTSSSPERFGKSRAELMSSGESGVSPYIVDEALIHDYSEYRYDPATWTGFTTTSNIDQEVMQFDEGHVPLDLSGQDLIAYYDNMHQCHKAWVQQMLNLRKELLREATAISSEMTDVIWANNDPIDFIKFAGIPGLFNRYANLLEAFRQEKASAQSLCQTVKIVKAAFEANKHLIGGENNGILLAIKQGVIQYSRDMAEVLDWTQPNSMTQVHELIFLHRRQDPEKLIRQEVIKMQKMASRL